MTDSLKAELQLHPMAVRYNLLFSRKGRSGDDSCGHAADLCKSSRPQRSATESVCVPYAHIK